MADIGKAIDFVLRQEDSTLSGICTNNPADRGGLTRFGIASRWHPELVRSGFYAAMREDALLTARQVYTREYASHLNLPAIKSQAIANAMMSFAILENAAQAVIHLQRACNLFGGGLTVDGSVGPMTVKAINSVRPGDLLTAYVEQNKAFLLSLIDKDPSQIKWRHGWMRRCAAIALQSTEVLV